MGYLKTKDHWEQKNITVHADVSDKSIRSMADCVIKHCKTESNDTILDIGCGDGLVDNYVKKSVKELHGFDFSQHLIDRAKINNIECKYWCQSFLEPVNNGILYDKAFSYGVFQYCKPNDIGLIIKSSIGCLKGGGTVVHFDIPDSAKMKHLYFRNKSIYKRITGVISLLIFKSLSILNYHLPFWKDGTYWHNVQKVIKECNKLGYKAEMIDAQSIYRSHLKIYKNL